MDWHTNIMPTLKDLDSNEGKKNIRNLNGTDIAEVSQYLFNGSLTVFGR